jgi:membrane-associated phospholipid phosphatase
MSGAGQGTRAMQVGDGLLTSACALIAAWLWTGGRWVPGAGRAAWVWTVLAVGVPFLRGLSRRVNVGWPGVVRAFWPAPVLVLGHAHFGPVVDGLNPRLHDAVLARADLLLFGTVPSLVTERWIPGPAMDLLLVCYYSYFLWPLLVGASIFQRSRAAYAEYRLAMVLFFIVNFALYVAVPAVGPRFFLAGLYAAPLQGWVLTPWLDGLMRVTDFNRDCFPSGHTGFTFIVLVYAALHARRIFWFMAPVASGLVAATVLARFHYGVDLLCAVPAVIACVAAASWVARPERAASPRRLSFHPWRAVDEEAPGR